MRRDPTWAQLSTARAFQDESDLHFPLISAAAEMIPFADASFDLVISEYGASIWSDPYRWIPEAARVLRPGGALIFLVNGTLLKLCAEDDENGDWIRLLRRNGFEVEDLIEIRPPDDATSRYKFVSLDWARRWPSEEVWKALKK